MERKIRVLVAKPGLDGHDPRRQSYVSILRDVRRWKYIHRVTSTLKNSQDGSGKRRCRCSRWLCSTCLGSWNVASQSNWSISKKKRGTEELDVLVLAGMDYTR